MLITGVYDQTAKIVQTTSVSDQTSTVHTTGASKPSLASVLTTDPSESTTVQTTGPPEPTSTSEQIIYSTEQILTAARTTGTSESPSMTVQTIGTSDQSSSTLQMTGASSSDQTSTTSQTTGSSEAISTIEQTNGASEVTVTSMQTMGVFETTAVSNQRPRESTTELNTTGGSVAYETQQTLVSEGTTPHKTDFETIILNTETEGITSTKQFTSTERMTTNNNAATFSETTEYVSRTNKGTGKNIPFTNPTTREISSTTIFSTDTEESRSSFEGSSTTQLDDSAVSEMTHNERTTAYTEIFPSHNEISTADTIALSGRMTISEVLTTFIKATEKIPGTHKDKEKESPSTIEIMEFSASSTNGIQDTAISESNIQTAQSTGIYESSVTESITESEKGTRSLTERSVSNSPLQSTNEPNLSTEPNTSKKILVSGETTESVAGAEISTTDGMTTPEQMLSSETESTVLTTGDIIASTDESIPTEGTISAQTSYLETSSVSVTIVTEASSSTLTSETNLSTTPSTVEVPTTTTIVTSTNDLSFRVSKSNSEVPDFTSGEKQSSSRRFTNFASSSPHENESTSPYTSASISVSTVETLSTRSSTTDVLETDSTIQPLFTLETTVLESSTIDETATPEKVTKAFSTVLTTAVSTSLDASSISVSTTVENLRTESSTTGVPVYSLTGESLETNSMHQLLFTSETTVSEGSTTVWTTTPGKTTKIFTDSTVLTRDEYSSNDVSSLISPLTTLETTVSKVKTTDRTITPEKVTKAETDSTAEETKFPNMLCSCGSCRIQDFEDCTKYSECVNDEYVFKQCDIGYLFSSTLGRCEMAENVECDKLSEQCLKSDGFFADTKDCSSFVQCYNSISYKKTCPTGLLYNPVKRTCNILSNCGAPPVLPTSRSLDVDCDCDYCIMGDSEDCSKYYLCLDGIAYDETCGEGLKFNSETATCDYEESAVCASQSPQCTTKNGDFPSSSNCSSYHHCVGGVAYDKECAPGFHFSAGSGRCEEACEAGCDPSLECPVTSELPTCLSPDDLYPNPEDCRTFFECSEGLPKMAECTNNEHFNLVKQICQDPCQAMCDPQLDCVNSTNDFTDSGTTVFTQSATSSAWSLETAEETKGSVPTHVTSRRKSMETERTHSTDLYSSVHPGTSSNEFITEFTSRSTKFITQSSLFPDETVETSPSSYFALCPESTGVYSDPEECRTLYLCINGYPMKLYCDDHLHFNPLTKRCESPCSASCDPSLDCPTPEEAETPTPLPLLSCRTKDLLSKRGSCRLYYDCTRSRLRKTEKCPKGLHFNPTKRVCDLPQKSGCGEPAKGLPAPYSYYRCPCEACLMHAEDNCLEYFVCLDYTAYRMKCSDGLLFDKRRNTCNFANKVICDSSTTPYQPTGETYIRTTGHPYATETFTTTKSYTTTRQPYTTPTTTSTSRPYTTTTTRMPYSTSTTRKPYTTSTTRKPYTTSTTRQPYTTSTTRQPYTTPTTRQPYTTPTTSQPYTTPTTSQPFTTPTSTNRPYKTSASTGRPYTISTTRKPYATLTNTPYITNTMSQTNTSSTSTSRQYTTSTTREPFTTSIKWLYTTSTPRKPYITPTSTSRPYTTSTQSEPYISSITRSLQGSYRCSEANGMFRNPKDCSSFIHCSNLIPSLKECPGGLHFSMETQQCEYPCDAKCDESLACASTSTISPTTSNPLCACRNCLRPNPESCTKFFECKDGLPTKRDCPKGQTFDARISRCDWDHQGNCQPSEICPRRNGVYPYKRDCHKFVVCSNGIPKTRDCPPRLQFDPVILRCTFASGPCDSSVPLNETKGKLSPPVPVAPQWHCPGSFGYYRHEVKCNRYYHCIEGVATLKECPVGLHFNSKYGTCDWPKDVNCRATQTPLERRCRVYRGDFRCPSNRSYVSSLHCDMFFDCRTGKACIKTCPEGLYFNFETSMCDLPVNARCRKSDGGSYSLKKFSEICKHGSRQQAVDPTTSKCYYKCHRNKVRRVCCTRSSTYNEKRRVCERKTVFHFQSE